MVHVGWGAGGGALIVDAKQPQAVVDGGVACIRCTTLIDGKEGRQSGVLQRATGGLWMSKAAERVCAWVPRGTTRADRWTEIVGAPQ